MHYEAYKSVSGPHYEAFLTADLSAETYLSAGGETSKNVRIFSKDNLSTPRTDDRVSFDPQREKKVFKNDPQLQELFVRIATNTTEDDDWLKGRPRSVARIHEVIRSHPEFNNLSKRIKDNSAREYLKEKSDMNEVLTKELKL